MPLEKAKVKENVEKAMAIAQVAKRAVPRASRGIHPRTMEKARVGSAAKKAVGAENVPTTKKAKEKA